MENVNPPFFSRIFHSSPRIFLLILLLVAYLPIIPLGYGSDCDSYQVLDTGRIFLESGSYRPSRNPGFPVFEALVLVLNHVGGFYAVNVGSIFASIGAVLLLFGLSRRFHLSEPFVLAATLGLSPYFWLNATCGMDYNWGLFFLLFGFSDLVAGRSLRGGFLLSLAVGCRLSNILAAIGIAVYSWCFTSPLRNGAEVETSHPASARSSPDHPFPWGRFLAWSACVAGLVTIYYLPSIAYSGWSLAFLKLDMGDSQYWTWKLRIGKFLYKNIYFGGFFASFSLGILFILGLKRMFSFHLEDGTRILHLGLFIILCYEGLFFRFPMEPAYLLPAAPFMLMVLGRLFTGSPRALRILSVLIVSSSLVNLNLAKGDRPDFVSKVSFGIWLEKGTVLKDFDKRKIFLGISNRSDYETVWQNHLKNRRPNE